MSGSSPRTPITTLTQSLKTKNRTRSSKRSNSEHVSMTAGGGKFFSACQKLIHFYSSDLIPFLIACILSPSSIYKTCDRPSQLPQHQFQSGREDDGDAGPGRPDHQTQQQGREPPDRHVESKKQTERCRSLVKGKTVGGQREGDDRLHSDVEAEQNDS